MREKKLMWSSLKCGIVISAAFAILFSAIFFSGNISSYLNPRIGYTAFIPNVGGMRPGAPVWFHGIEIGSVESITLVDSGAVVNMSIQEKFSPLIKNDATVRVLTMGLLGDKYLEIGAGTQSAIPAKQDDILQGNSATGMEEIIESAVISLNQITALGQKAEEIMNEFSQSEGSLKRFLNDPEMYDNLTQATDRFLSIAENIESSQGTLSMLINDPQLYHSLHYVSKQLTSVLEQIESGPGLASGLLNNENMANDMEYTLSAMKNTIESLGNTAASLDSLILDIKDNPRDYFKFSIF
ncbi:Mammalian cell entry related domain protein [Chitinispirillum alkaliphilum]|nr:Mammalian cell entry related domain protein [Chitinispirillum alkaliphilum]